MVKQAVSTRVLSGGGGGVIVIQRHVFGHVFFPKKDPHFTEGEKKESTSGDVIGYSPSPAKNEQI